jgi:Rrf2 family transcriptional regulator, nitric oxide-sensitive transcriptional repressor
MLSRTAEYALQAIVCLAQKGGQAGLSTEVIAKSTNVPPSYLVKVLGLLARSGIVRSQRGLYGGYTLAKDTLALTFLDVINAVDPIRRVHRCPIHQDGTSDQLCPLHLAIDRAISTVEHELASVKLSALVRISSKKAPVCGCRGPIAASRGRVHKTTKPRGKAKTQK